MELLPIVRTSGSFSRAIINGSNHRQDGG
jgi:hypothetical protein